MWKENGVKRRELQTIMEMLWDILQQLHLKRFGHKYTELTLDYNGIDVTRIMKVAENKEILEN